MQDGADNETDPTKPRTNIGYETTQASNNCQNEEVRQTEDTQGDNVNNDRDRHNGELATDKGVEYFAYLQSESAEIFLETFDVYVDYFLLNAIGFRCDKERHHVGDHQVEQETTHKTHQLPCLGCCWLQVFGDRLGNHIRVQVRQSKLKRSDDNDTVGPCFEEGGQATDVFGQVIKQVLQLCHNRAACAGEQPDNQPGNQEVNNGCRYAPGNLQAFVDQSAKWVKQKRNDECCDHQLEVIIKADDQREHPGDKQKTDDQLGWPAPAG